MSSSELIRRACAFDRVLEALRAVAALSDEDLEMVAPDPEGTIAWSEMQAARRHSAWALSILAPADLALNAALELLDTAEQEERDRERERRVDSAVWHAGASR